MDLDALVSAIAARRGATAEEAIKSLQVGTTFQYGTDAAVVALVNGKRCIKIMAHLPPEMKVSPAGLRALYVEWCSWQNAIIERERAMRILFAAELAG